MAPRYRPNLGCPVRALSESLGISFTEAAWALKPSPRIGDTVWLPQVVHDEFALIATKRVPKTPNNQERAKHVESNRLMLGAAAVTANGLGVRFTRARPFDIPDDPPDFLFPSAPADDLSAFEAVPKYCDGLFTAPEFKNSEHYDLMLVPPLKTRKPRGASLNIVWRDFHSACADRKALVVEWKKRLHEAGFYKRSESGSPPEIREWCPRCGGSFWRNRNGRLVCYDCRYGFHEQEYLAVESELDEENASIIQTRSQPPGRSCTPEEFVMAIHANGMLRRAKTLAQIRKLIAPFKILCSAPDAMVCDPATGNSIRLVGVYLPRDLALESGETEVAIATRTERIFRLVRQHRKNGISQNGTEALSRAAKHNILKKLQRLIRNQTDAETVILTDENTIK